MGELDEKESAPANAPTTTTPTADVISVDEQKETETLLTANADTKSVADSIGAPAAIESPKSSTSTTVTIEKEPEEIAVTSMTSAATADGGGDDEKEKEKLLPAEDATVAATTAASSVAAAVTPEGREVKPKKIPIGGIKMPGFFTKSKPKTDDGADGELLEKSPTTATAIDVEVAKDADVSKADEVAAGTEEGGKSARAAGFFAALRNIRNPFAKRQAVKTTDDAEDDGEVKEIKIDGECGKSFNGEQY